LRHLLEYRADGGSNTRRHSVLGSWRTSRISDLESMRWRTFTTLRACRLNHRGVLTRFLSRFFRLHGSTSSSRHGDPYTPIGCIRPDGACNASRPGYRPTHCLMQPGHILPVKSPDSPAVAHVPGRVYAPIHDGSVN